MTTQLPSKERLEEVANNPERYSEIAVAMARALLAAYEQEPDYIRYDCGCCGFETLDEWRDNDVCPKCNHKPLGKTELFSHPAPSIPAVMPEDADPRDAFERVFPIPKHAIRCGKGYACTEYNAWDAHKFVDRWDGWNACHAAMLNGGKS